MKKQLRAIGAFWREEYGRFVGMTSAAFLVLILLSYAAGRLFPDIPVTVIGYFNEAIAGSGIVQDDGSFNVLALLVLPLLVIAAFMEAYVTPAVMQLFL